MKSHSTATTKNPIMTTRNCQPSDPQTPSPSLSLGCDSIVHDGRLRRKRITLSFLRCGAVYESCDENRKPDAGYLMYGCMPRIEPLAPALYGKWFSEGDPLL
jgi:hypothetical protein